MATRSRVVPVRTENGSNGTAQLGASVPRIEIVSAGMGAATAGLLQQVERVRLRGHVRPVSRGKSRGLPRVQHLREYVEYEACARPVRPCLAPSLWATRALGVLQLRRGFMPHSGSQIFFLEVMLRAQGKWLREGNGQDSSR